MIYKYARNIITKSYGPGRRSDPSKWITGEDPLTRDKYYAWLKHRAQAKHRKEEYDLTWEDWQSLWSDDNFKLRGRLGDNLCLTRSNFAGPWCLSNVKVVTRLEHFRMKKEMNNAQSRL